MAHEYNGNSRGRLLGCSRVNRTGCHDDIDWKPHEIFRELAHSPGVSLGPTKLNDDIGSLDVAQPPELLAERFEGIGECVRILPQKTDTVHLAGLLRTRGERPHRRAAEQGDELATSDHSITSSAATSMAGGTVSPSALAVLRLTTVSNLVGACTGRSAGL